MFSIADIRGIFGNDYDTIVIMPWPFGGGKEQPSNQPDDDDLDAPDDAVDPERAARYWANKLGIKHDEPDPEDETFDENLSWEERKRKRLGNKGFEKLKLHNQREHQNGLANIKRSIQRAIADGRNEYARKNTAYPVVAVAILGSWAEGQTHRDSDLDIFILLSEYDVRIQADFIQRLQKHGIRMKIDCQGFDYLQPGRSAESALDSFMGLFAPHRIIVRE